MLARLFVAADHKDFPLAIEQLLEEPAIGLAFAIAPDRTRLLRSGEHFLS